MHLPIVIPMYLLIVIPAKVGIQWFGYMNSGQSRNDGSGYPHIACGCMTGRFR